MSVMLPSMNLKQQAQAIYHIYNRRNCTWWFQRNQWLWYLCAPLALVLVGLSTRDQRPGQTPGKNTNQCQNDCLAMDTWQHNSWFTTWSTYTVFSLSLLLKCWTWYEIMALYYVKSILIEISASRQDRRVLQKSKIIRIEFLSKWGMLQTSRYV